LVKTKVAPFLKAVFPNLREFQILLDGEKVMHGPAAKTAFREHKITVLPSWPKYWNPQEHVSTIAEKAPCLRAGRRQLQAVEENVGARSEGLPVA
jgi:hypothetical protein